MAIISEKHTRRNRVQFTMTRQMYEAHQRNLDLARELGAIVDFNRDFERWFGGQVEQVAKELQRLKEERNSLLKPKQSLAADTLVKTTRNLPEEAFNGDN